MLHQIAIDVDEPLGEERLSAAVVGGVARHGDDRVLPRVHDLTHAVLGGDPDALVRLRAERRDDVGVRQAGLQEIEFSVVGPVRLERGGGEARFGERALGEARVGGHAVDGEDRLDVPEEGIVLVDGLEIGRDESALPVVAVDDLRLPLEALERFQDAAAKENKPFVVVGKVFL